MKNTFFCSFFIQHRCLLNPIPPLFIVHGEQDIQVPINQSIELWTTYQAKNEKVQIKFVPDAGH